MWSEIKLVGRFSQANLFNYIASYLNTELASLLMLLEAIFYYVYLYSVYYAQRGDRNMLYYFAVGSYIDVFLIFALLSRYSDPARWIQILRVNIGFLFVAWLLLTPSHALASNLEEIAWPQKLSSLATMLVYALGIDLLLGKNRPSRTRLVIGFTLALIGLAPWRIPIVVLVLLS